MQDKFQNAIMKGSRATERLNDPVFKEAIEALRSEYIKAWASSQSADVREGLWRRYTQIDEVCQHLTTLMNNGKLAKAQIEQLNKAA